MFRKMILALMVTIGVAVSSQASAEMLTPLKSCDCFSHTVVSGDWISKVTKAKLNIVNDPDLFREVAKLSGVKDPKFVIRPGQVLLIPKNYKSAKTVVVKVSAEKKVMLSVTSMKLGIVPLPILKLPMGMTISPETLESPKESIIQKKSVETVAMVKEPGTVKTVLEVPTVAVAKNTVAKVTVIREGLYKFTVTNGMKVGVFPAVVVSNVDDQGRWERKETVAHVKKADGGNFELVIPVNKTMRVSETSFVVFDLGDGNATHVSSEDLVGADSFVPGKMKVVPLEKAKYVALHEGFSKKPNFGKKVGKGILKIGVPSIVGFFTGGPVGAVSPIGYAAFSHFRDKAQRKAARKLAQ